jgi:voltage-gated potassium channel Kch
LLPFVTVLVRFVRAIGRSWRDSESRGLFILVVVTLFSGTLFYRQVEGWSFLDSLYFSVVTLTTVGHGDLSPSTAAGKVLRHPVRLRETGIVLGFVNAVAERSQERQSEARERRRQRREAGREEE